MSYTHQTVSWVSVGAQNAWGDVEQDTAVSIIARKQPKQELVKTSEGREVLSRSIYYVDPVVVPRASEIKRLDTLDGERIEAIYVMCDRYNRPKLYRYTTV